MSASNVSRNQNVEASGVSVVICTHNGASGLKRSIDSLLNQEIPADLRWEIVVVDNASTDDSSKVADQILTNQRLVSYQIVTERRLGLIFARTKGIEVSSYEIVAFVDDDNRVQSDWVHQAYSILGSHPEVGVCGGLNEAVFEGKRPEWFGRFQNSFGTGPHARPDPQFVFGAGMILRKTAWNQAIEVFDGYFPKCLGRQGNLLTLGEDNEICYAVRALGWEVRYDPRLRLLHDLSDQRLTPNYLEEVQKRYGQATVSLDPYLLARESGFPPGSAIRRTWLWQWTLTLVKLALFRLSSSCLTLVPGAVNVRLESRLRTVRHSYRLRELMRFRSQYIKNIREVRNRIRGRVKPLSERSTKISTAP